MNFIKDFEKMKSNKMIEDEIFVADDASETSGVKKSVQKKHKKKKKSKKAKLVTAGIIIAIVLCVGCLIAFNFDTVLAAFGISSDMSEGLQDNKKYTMLTAKEKLFEDVDLNSLFGTDTINILLFGLDGDESRDSEYTTFRSDTIILVSINFTNKTLSMVSVPRDSYVDIYSRGGRAKINSCFYYGSLNVEGSDETENFNAGVEVLKGTVSDLFGGIPINYYVGVDMDAATQIVDDIGGVYYEHPGDVYAAGLYQFPGGNRVYSGYEFLVMARNRDYSEGDIQRTSVQRDLIKALFNQVKTMKITKLPKVISTAMKAMKTDMKVRDAVSLGLSLMKDFDSSSISSATFPGTFGNLYGISYWIIDQSARVDFIASNYGISTSYLSQDPTFIAAEGEVPADEDTIVPPGSTTGTGEEGTEGGGSGTEGGGSGTEGGGSGTEGGGSGTEGGGSGTEGGGSGTEGGGE